MKGMEKMVDGDKKRKGKKKGSGTFAPQ